MKKISLSFLITATVLFSFSCKKEISPDLEVTVVDDTNAPVPRVWVKTSVPGAVFGFVNGEVIDSAETDQFGKAFFKFKNTILVDIGLFKTQSDTILIDSSSALLEIKRKARGSSNTIEKKLVFR